MSRNTFRANESFHLRRPSRVMEVITHAFLIADCGRFDVVLVGLFPFRCAFHRASVDAVDGNGRSVKTGEGKFASHGLDDTNKLKKELD